MCGWVNVSMQTLCFHDPVEIITVCVCVFVYVCVRVHLCVCSCASVRVCTFVCPEQRASAALRRLAQQNCWDDTNLDFGRRTARSESRKLGGQAIRHPAQTPTCNAKHQRGTLRRLQMRDVALSNGGPSPREQVSGRHFALLWRA